MYESPVDNNNNNKKQSSVIIEMPEIIINNPSNQKLPLFITIIMLIIMGIAVLILFTCPNTIQHVQSRSLLTTELIQSAEDPHLNTESMKSLLDSLLSDSHQQTLTNLSFSEWIEFVEALQQSRICNTDTWSIMANKIKKIESAAFGLGNSHFWHDLRTHDKILTANSGKDIIKALDPEKSEGAQSLLHPSDFGVYVRALQRFQVLHAQGMIQRDEDSIQLLNTLILNPNQEMWSKLEANRLGIFLQSIAEMTKEPQDVAAISIDLMGNESADNFATTGMLHTPSPSIL